MTISYCTLRYQNYTQQINLPYTAVRRCNVQVPILLIDPRGKSNDEVSNLTRNLVSEM